MATTIAPGGRIDEGVAFAPVRIGILTISDTRDESNDTSGDTLADRAKSAGHIVTARAIVRDDIDKLRQTVLGWIDAGKVQVVITTGGTGLTGRDVTIEALEPLFDKRIDGFSAVFHLVSYQSVGTSTMQSRATAGLLKGAIVFCLPGSTGGVKDGWSVIAPQLDSRHKPCNFVELMPRFDER